MDITTSVRRLQGCLERSVEERNLHLRCKHFAPPPSKCAHLPKQRFVRQKLPQSLRQSNIVFWRNKKSALLGDDLERPAHGSTYHREARLHGFDKGNSEWLRWIGIRMTEDVSCRQKFRHVTSCAEKANALGDIEFRHQGLQSFKVADFLVFLWTSDDPASPRQRFQRGEGPK